MTHLILHQYFIIYRRNCLKH